MWIIGNGIMAKPLRLFFVGLLNLALLFTSVVAQAGGHDHGCDQTAEATQHAIEAHHAHGSHAMTTASDDETPTADPIAKLPVCCSHGCLVDLALTAPLATATPAGVDVPAACVLANLSDLTGPTGLRRPPKG